MSGYIYLGFDASGLFKIGITNDVEKRLRQFRTANPTFFLLLHIPVEHPAVVEVELHTKFSDKRVRGEWFCLDGGDLLYIYDRLLGEDGNSHNLEDFQKMYEIISVKKVAKEEHFIEDMKIISKENGWLI